MLIFLLGVIFLVCRFLVYKYLGIDEKLNGKQEILQTSVNIVLEMITIILITLGIVRFVYGEVNILHELKSLNVSILFLTFLVSGFYEIAKFWFLDQVGIKKETYSWKMKLAFAITSLLFVLGAVLYFGGRWFKASFDGLTSEQLLFLLTAPADGSDEGVMNTILNTPVLATVILSFLFLRLYWNMNSYEFVWGTVKNKLVKIGLSIAAIFLFIGGSFFAYKTAGLGDLYKAFYVSSDYIEDNYVATDVDKLKFPEKKRNLIHIYYESVENTFFDKAAGGFEEENLMPDLQRFIEDNPKSVMFSHNDKFGGAKQTYGSGWSVAGMVNMDTGLPLKVPIQDANAQGQDGYFMPGVTTIGDVLHDKGYNQAVMFGSNADFGGLTTYYKTHGQYEIFDYEYAKKNGDIPKDYKVFWGYEDDKLYKFAKEEITNLAKEKKPFNFKMENADTHAPNGYLPADAEKPFEKPYANAIFHSQKEMVKFIEWIQDQPFYDNTTVVITGDHLSMPKPFFEDNHVDEKDRTTFNLILNGDFTTKIDKKDMKNREFAPFDYYPTMLASLGVEIPGNRLGLGTNLASGEETLMERDGFDKMNDEISLLSRYYDDNFMSKNSSKDPSKFMK